MWHIPKNTIPESQIFSEHLRVLEEAVNDAELYDVRNSAVYEALDYIAQAKPWVRWHCTQFRRALEEWSPEHLIEAMGNIKKKI